MEKLTISRAPQLDSALAAQKERIREIMANDPNWFLQIGSFYDALESPRSAISSPERFRQAVLAKEKSFIALAGLRAVAQGAGSFERIRDYAKQEVWGFLEELYVNGEIYVGETGEDWDADRQPVRLAVVHHTHNKPGMTLDRLNAIHLWRLYRPYYTPPHTEYGEEHIKGDPIYSNHFRDGDQVFWAYHWLVRSDGTPEPLLNKEAIGWHAGNWDVNCESIAICVDDDLSHGRPSSAVMEGIAHIIEKNYKSELEISPSTIKGHGEINHKTDCPGQPFHSAWKNDLLELLSE